MSQVRHPGLVAAELVGPVAARVVGSPTRLTVAAVRRSNRPRLTKFAQNGLSRRLPGVGTLGLKPRLRTASNEAAYCRALRPCRRHDAVGRSRTTRLDGRL